LRGVYQKIVLVNM